jgi:hypothetical protein
LANPDIKSACKKLVRIGTGPVLGKAFWIRGVGRDCRVKHGIWFGGKLAIQNTL